MPYKTSILQGGKEALNLLKALKEKGLVQPEGHFNETSPGRRAQISHVPSNDTEASDANLDCEFFAFLLSAYTVEENTF